METGTEKMAISTIIIKKLVYIYWHTPTDPLTGAHDVQNFNGAVLVMHIFLRDKINIGLVVFW